MHTTVCILDRNGKRVKRRTIRGAWSKIVEELELLPGKVAVCYEASTGYGYLHEILPLADQPIVNPLMWPALVVTSLTTSPSGPLTQQG